MMSNPVPQGLKTLTHPELRSPVRSSELWDVTAHGCDDTPGAARVYLWGDVIEELVYAALERPDVMQSALLSGQHYQGPDGPFVEVRGYADLSRYDSASEILRELNDDWTLLNNRVERQGEGLRLVGWALLEARATNQLSRAAQVVHRTFFNLGFQLLVEVDPAERRIAVYGFDERGCLINTPFYLVRRREGVDISSDESPVTP